MELKSCQTCSRVTKKRRVLPPLPPDRLSSLPDDLLGRILSMVQTKDVAAIQVLSKRMKRAFSLITSVDLDDSPYLLERFPLFKSFVIKVLQNLGEGLTRFRICLGGDKTTRVPSYSDEMPCLPYMEHALLNAWISYPLAHSCLRELDLIFHISNPDEYKLPSQLFEGRSLEFFSLDANIWIHGADIPLIRFPNLKVLHIFSVVFTEDEFVTRLVSSCHVLEDLELICKWEKLQCMTISSHSLRRLSLCLSKYDDEDNERITDRVLIDTPNVQYFSFEDTIPKQYVVSHMSALVEAEVNVFGGIAAHVWIQLSLLRALSNVHHLYLHGDCLEVMCSAPELKDQLPIFHNLRSLKLSPFVLFRWDIMVPLFLRFSPLLEALVFPHGLHGPVDTRDKDMQMEEAEGWRTNLTLPLCFPIHLKRVEFVSCYGLDFEWNLIKYVLCKASALEELVICLSTEFCDYPGQEFAAPNFEEFVSKLEMIPRASNSCYIIVDQ